MKKWKTKLKDWGQHITLRVLLNLFGFYLMDKREVKSNEGNRDMATSSGWQGRINQIRGANLEGVINHINISVG